MTIRHVNFDQTVYLISMQYSDIGDIGGDIVNLKIAPPWHRP